MSKNLKRTEPMSLIPTVCGAVKALQSRSNGLLQAGAHPRSMDDLNRQGFEMVKDAMQRALSKRVLEISPAGNFRLKIVTDKGQAQELADIFTNDLKKNYKRREGKSIRSKRSNIVNTKKTKLNKFKKTRTKLSSVVRIRKSKMNRSKPTVKRPRTARKQVINKKEKLDRKREKAVRKKVTITESDIVILPKSKETFSDVTTEPKLTPSPKQSPQKQVQHSVEIHSNLENKSKDIPISAETKFLKPAKCGVKRLRKELSNQDGGQGNEETIRIKLRRQSEPYKDKLEKENLIIMHKKPVKASESMYFNCQPSTSKDTGAPLKNRQKTKDMGEDYHSKKNG